MKKNTTKVALAGLLVLPTSTRAHAHEPEKGTAFLPGSTLYFVSAEYPALVAVQAMMELELAVGDEFPAQHAEVTKNLPTKEIVGIRRPDGTIEGVVPPKGDGVPHWEFIPGDRGTVEALAAANGLRERIEEAKERREKEARERRERKAARA